METRLTGNGSSRRPRAENNQNQHDYFDQPLDVDARLTCGARKLDPVVGLRVYAVRYSLMSPANSADAVGGQVGNARHAEAASVYEAAIERTENATERNFLRAIARRCPECGVDPNMERALR
jgi:hypothetical protein